MEAGILKCIHVPCSVNDKVSANMFVFHFLLQHRHNHPHPQRAADSVSQHSSQSDKSGDSLLNGEQQRGQGSRGSSRRSSHNSQQHPNYVRRDFGDVQRSVVESPRPQRSLEVQRSLDLHHGSMDQMSSPTHFHTSHSHHHPLYIQRQESFPRDDYLGYAREVSSQYPDVSQITAVQVTPRPKPRAFPRTNPAYVGFSRRDGAPSYKRINIEQHQPPTAIYNQRFYSGHSQPGGEGSGSGSSVAAMQTSQTYFPDLGDRLSSLRMDQRSDSDTSHSSYGISRLQQDMTDSMISMGSFAGIRPPSSGGGRDHLSDSHSSQGSLRGLPESHSPSSQGSLRSNTERDYLQDSPSLSPRHSQTHHQAFDHRGSHGNSSDRGLSRHHQPPPPSSPQHIYDEPPPPPHKQSPLSRKSKNVSANTTNTSSTTSGNVSDGSQRSLTRRNSEPDYANLPIIAHLRSGKIMTVDDPITKQEQEKMSSSLHSNDDQRIEDLKSGDSLRSGDSLSPAEYSTRHDTPNSIRSHSTQDSRDSRNSEGWLCWDAVRYVILKVLTCYHNLCV